MPDATYAFPGERISHTPGSAVASGEVVVVNGRCFVATQPIAANVAGSLAAEGAFRIAKTAGLAINLGDLVFWDDTANEANKTASGNTYLGVCVAAAATTDTTVLVLLDTLAGVAAPASAGQLATLNLTNGGQAIPFVLGKLCTSASGGDVTVLAAPVKLRVIDWWMIARDTNAANVKPHQGTAGTDDIADAVAKGTTTAAIVRGTKVIDAKATVTAGTSIKANFSAQGSAEVFLLCVAVP